MEPGGLVNDTHKDFICRILIFDSTLLLNVQGDLKILFRNNVFCSNTHEQFLAPSRHFPRNPSFSSNFKLCRLERKEKVLKSYFLCYAYSTTQSVKHLLKYLWKNEEDYFVCVKI